jgi:SsrA-binding protein
MSKSFRFRKDITIENRKARFDYEVVETFETGIVLMGCEVKSILEGKASLTGAFAVPKGKELWLQGMHITPYVESRGVVIDPIRDRKLLLHRRQMANLIEEQSRKGYSIIPLKLYFTDRGYAKILIGLCRGKKLHDKRETIKARDNEREMRREIAI